MVTAAGQKAPVLHHNDDGLCSPGRFAELVDAALERTAEGLERVGVVHIRLGAPEMPDEAGPVNIRQLAEDLCGLLGPGEVLSRLGPDDLVLLSTGPIDQVLGSVVEVAVRLSDSYASVDVAVAVDVREEAVELIERALRRADGSSRCRQP